LPYLVNVKFETLTYSAIPTDYSVIASAPSTLGRSDDDGGAASSYLPKGMADFLLRLMAYFQGTLSSLPGWDYIGERDYPVEGRLTVIDTALEGGSELLQKVRMNRHLSRRLRWLIKRGRVATSGKMRVATAEDDARCHLTPGQFNEYSIRVDGQSRIKVYGFGLSRKVLRKIAICWAGLQGDGASLRRAMMCKALLSPD